ncbi:MAG: DUF58 domain-containing protein [Burkholderiales bacterium]|nr:DUF58 domain-containing protein [Burkholderiales bacterium]
MSGSPQDKAARQSGVFKTDPESILRRLEWTVVRRLDGQLQGDYRTLFRGFGIDLADLREYQPHDDVRYIDWNVTARLQIPHVREFHEDREVAAWFLLDLSGSVDFGSQAVRKRMLAAEFVSVLARLLTAHGNRVGAVLYAGAAGSVPDVVIPARGGRRHVLHLLDRMLGFTAPVGGKQTDLAGLIARAQRVMRRRSVVFLVSDFISSPGWERALALLARRHEIVAVRLHDPLEAGIPDLGLVVLQDAETGEQMFVDTRDRGFRRRFARAAAQREAMLREALASAGIDCLELATDDRLDEALLHFTRLRKRRSQLAAGGGSRASFTRN